MIVKAASEQNVYSQIVRPITTARLQVVAEKVACTAGAIINLSIFLCWLVLIVLACVPS